MHEGISEIRNGQAIIGTETSPSHLRIFSRRSVGVYSSDFIKLKLADNYRNWRDEILEPWFNLAHGNEQAGSFACHMMQKRTFEAHHFAE
jgi:hypothetical protein